MTKYKMPNFGPTGSTDVSGQTNAANYDVSGVPVYNPVKVNLQAVIDVSGNVQIFTVPSTSISDVVVCNYRMPKEALYGGDLSGVFEFVEPSGNRGAIRGHVSNRLLNNKSLFDGFNIACSGELIADLDGAVVLPALAGGLDASGVNPFKKYRGIANNEYTTYDTLGDLVLSLYASYLFGHPGATAAITNDVALVNYINGSLTTDARVSARLTAAIGSLTNDQATTIVDSVLSQDPNRATNVANRQIHPITLENHVPLRFIRDDVVYVSVTVQAPTVTTTGTGGAPDNTNAGSANLVGVAANAASNYPTTAPTIAFQITLG
jgi:hypothetical protein